MRWWMKAAIAGSCAHIPGGMNVFDSIRRRYGELANFERADGFRNAGWFLKTMRGIYGDVRDLTALEAGTGWVPAIPFCCALAGMKIETVDVASLVEPEFYDRFVDAAERHLPALASAADVDQRFMSERLETARRAGTFEKAMSELGCSWQAPVDTTNLEYPDNHVDVTLSNLVLQCMPKNVVPDVVRELHRITRPGGYSIHRMTMVDEYSAGDPGRSDFDFLRFPERTWNRWFCHRIKHLNRMRYSQFRYLLTNAGFDVVEVKREIDHDSIPHLQRKGVAPEFQHLSWEDLVTSQMEIVLQKPHDRPEEMAREQPCHSWPQSQPADHPTALSPAKIF